MGNNDKMIIYSEKERKNYVKKSAWIFEPPSCQKLSKRERESMCKPGCWVKLWSYASMNSSNDQTLKIA